MLAIAIKIVAAFVVACWWIVSYDVRVCNYVIISSTRLQFRQRHICNGRKTQKEYTGDILPESSAYVRIHKPSNPRPLGISR